MHSAEVLEVCGRAKQIHIVHHSRYKKQDPQDLSPRKRIALQLMMP